MTLRPFMIPTVCAFAALAACDGDNSVRITSSRTEDNSGSGVLKVVEALQCPQTMGTLTRKGSAQAGGTVCTYAGPKGAEVSLHLVPLDGELPADVLKAFETRLSRELPRALDQLKADDDTAAAAATGEAAVATAEAGAGAEADSASVRAPGVAIDAKGDDATVRLPGMRIETKGDRASVRIGGFHIDANDGEGAVSIQSDDNVSIQAHQDSAQIRTSAAGDATRASWILTDNRGSEAGWRLVGYEARGPVGGPLVVATVRSKDRQRGRAFEDARDLVTLNVGE